MNNQSTATITTQATNCAARMRNDSNLCNDAARLPMLQETEDKV